MKKRRKMRKLTKRMRQRHHRTTTIIVSDPVAESGRSIYSSKVATAMIRRHPITVSTITSKCSMVAMVNLRVKVTGILKDNKVLWTAATGFRKFRSRAHRTHPTPPSTMGEYLYLKINYNYQHVREKKIKTKCLSRNSWIEFMLYLKFL